MSNVWVIKDADGNITNSGIKASEDFMKKHHTYYEAFVAPSDGVNRAELDARMWRDQELLRTDSLMGLSDYPNTSALTTYRQELRDWPSTGAFPDTQPTLGS